MTLQSEDSATSSSMRLYFRYVGYTATLPDGRCVATERSYPEGLTLSEYRELVWQAQRAFPFRPGGSLEFRTQTMLVAQ